MDKTAPTLSLRDIHLPEDPGLWPLAPGLWVLLLVFLVVLYFTVRFVVKNIIRIKHEKKQKMLLLAELTTIRENFDQNKDKHQLSIALSSLLNRFVKYVLKDPIATSLIGKQWINYLNGRIVNSKINNNKIFDEFENALTLGQYNKNIDYDVSRLFAIVKNYFPQAINDQHKYNKIKLGGKNA